MESADEIVAVSHSKNSNLDKESVVSVVDHEINTDEGSNTVNSTNDKDKQINDDDQESVIIEEVVSNIIDLNEDTDEDVGLEIVQSTSNLPTTTNNSPTKATEFVIVNAANFSSSAIDVAEPAVEDIQIKDELSETIATDLNINDVLENDPMDLLELNHRSECSSSIRSQEETDYADDGSSIGSSSIQTGSSSSISVLDWIKEYPWLLCEEDEHLGYCLYCDSKINTKSQRSVKQHGMSLYHKERCENYMAFREEEEKNGLSMELVEIKEEFGTDSRIEALRLKRKSQSVALNNFNWRRWLEDHHWLERDSTEGTIGWCKYCHMHVNVEFSYLRERHQESTKHREAEKQHETPKSSDDPNKTGNTNENKDSTAENSTSKNHRWLEILEKEPTMARCKICGSKVVKNNFLRHLTTKLHEHNEKIYLESRKIGNQDDLDEGAARTLHNWKMFSKLHPWMISDPENPSFAYCKYCEKRIIYGTSAAKRATHEHSLQHKQNEAEFKRRSRKRNKTDTVEDNAQTEDETNVDEENVEEEEREEEDEENAVDNDDNADDEEENESDDENNKGNEDGEDIYNEREGEQEEKDIENESELKKRPKILTDEWLNQYSWCRKYKKDPKNFIFCIYCRIPLRPMSRRKHQNSSIHSTAEKEFLSRQAKKQNLEGNKQSNENLPFFEWAIPLKNNPSSYSCRYCRVRISKHYSKKQHASSKIHQINESIYKNNRRKSLRNDENNTDHSQPPPKTNTQQQNIATTKSAFAKVVIKAPSTVTLIKQHQKKFPWLGYKRSELRTHYGHCKICESSLYIRSLKHILRHTRSGRHISILKAKKRQKIEKEEEAEGNEVNEKLTEAVSKEELPTSPVATTEKEDPTLNTAESQKSFNYKSTIAEMKKRYSWIEKSDRPNYAYCCFCNANIPLKILFLRNHSNSPKHRHSVIHTNSIDGRKINRDNRGQNNSYLDNDANKSRGADNDVLIVDENNEEILISEQDENWTIKSETMDEHEELDYLLQRSFDNSSNTQRNVRKSTNVGDGPPAKRFKRSQSCRRLTDSNSSLVASLLTTPLTLASCLGPLIQQQIQQANLSQAQNSPSTMTTPESVKSSTMPVMEPENTYDLFFKSVSETMKKLPTDLAAEGKLRVMQVLCDLELQALKREQSARGEPVPSNFSGVLNYRAAPTSAVISDISAEQNGHSNETIITQLNVNTDNSPTTTTANVIPPNLTNSNTTENTTTPRASPIIGVMDKNGLQTLQLKTAVANQIPRNATSCSITSVANSGIRCIPFKNLSQPVTPISVSQQSSTQNTNAVNASKNLINFRNIQITKRIGTPQTSATSAVAPQQTIQKAPSIANNSPQRTYITNIQPQLQRWGCSVNNSTSIQQVSAQRTSTPISKK